MSLTPNKIKKRYIDGLIIRVRNFFNPTIRENKKIIQSCTPYTMISDYSLAKLISLVEVVNIEKTPGALVECGVWKGGACMAMALAQMKFSNEYRDIWLYDTFDGMTEPAQENDGPKASRKYHDIRKGKHVDRYDKWHNKRKWIYYPLDKVQANMRLTGYLFNRIKFIKGDVNYTIDSDAPSQVAILRLDTDWYKSTKKELSILAPKVSKSGYIIIDDYYAWEGAKKATDEFLANNLNRFEIIDKHSPEPLILKKIF